MNRRGIRRKAEELLGLGCSKQQTFDNLMLEHPELKPKRVADVIRYLPTWFARERYRELHRTLLGLVAANAMLRILPPVLLDGIRLDQATAYLSLVPIATLLVGYGLYRWQGEFFGWVGWGNVISSAGLFGQVLRIADVGFEPWVFAFDVLGAGIGGIALFLHFRVFQQYTMDKDPLGQMQPRVVFPSEPGMGA